MECVATILSNYSKQELAEISNKLNEWEWDDRLGKKPENWDGILDFHLSKNYKLPTKHKIIKPYITFIHKTIGEKEVFRWHHTHNLQRTKFEFEIWWLKRLISKLLRIGFYNKRFQKQLREVLINIAQDNQTDQVKEKYYNGN